MQYYHKTLRNTPLFYPHLLYAITWFLKSIYIGVFFRYIFSDFSVVITSEEKYFLVSLT